eukprot:1138030-Pelagomonas_calceolata.AAC.5
MNGIDADELHGDLVVLLIDVHIFLSPQQSCEAPKSLLEQDFSGFEPRVPVSHLHRDQQFYPAPYFKSYFASTLPSPLRLVSILIVAVQILYFVSAYLMINDRNHLAVFAVQDHSCHRQIKPGVFSQQHMEYKWRRKRSAFNPVAGAASSSMHELQQFHVLFAALFQVPRPPGTRLTLLLTHVTIEMPRYTCSEILHLSLGDATPKSPELSNPTRNIGNKLVAIIQAMAQQDGKHGRGARRKK